MHAMHAHPIKKVNSKRSVAFLRPPKKNPFGTAAKSWSCKAAVVSPLYFIKVQILGVNSGPLETLHLSFWSRFKVGLNGMNWWSSSPKMTWYIMILYTKCIKYASKCTCLSHMVSVYRFFLSVSFRFPPLGLSESHGITLADSYGCLWPRRGATARWGSGCMTWCMAGT